MKKGKLFAAVLACVALAAAGCGGGTSAAGTGTAGSPVTSAPTSPATAGQAASGSAGASTAESAAAGTSVAVDQALHDQLPASVKSKGTLVMATDATIGAPFASFAPDGRTVIGANVDVAQALGSVLGVKVDVVNTPFDTFIPGLQAGRYDFSVSVMLDTKAREKVVDFVDYIKDGSGFLVRSDETNDNLTLADMCGMKAGALSGSAEFKALQEQSGKCTSAGKPAVTISVFPGNTQGVLALISQRIDVWVSDSDINAWIKTQEHGKVKQSGQPFEESVDGIALTKGSPLVPIIKDALQKLMDNGAYLAVLTHYGIQEGALSKATVNAAQY